MLDFSEKWSTEKRADLVRSMPGDTFLDKLIAAYVEIDNTISDILEQPPDEERSKCRINAHECRNQIESSIAYALVLQRYEKKNGRLVKRPGAEIEIEKNGAQSKKGKDGPKVRRKREKKWKSAEST